MVLAGVELIFFVEACMVLCFGCKMRTMLVTHGCVVVAGSAHPEPRPLLLHVLPSQRGTGGALGAGRGHGGDSWPRLPKGVSHPPHGASCSAITAGVRRRREGCLE